MGEQKKSASTNATAFVRTGPSFIALAGTVLHLAAGKGYAAAVHYLKVLGSDPESSENPLEIGALDAFGRSPLELAVEIGSVETVRVLLEGGCVVNQKMVRQAVLGDSVELASLLVTRLSEGSVAAGEMLRVHYHHYSPLTLITN